MGCFCDTCQQLARRKLRAIPIVNLPQSRQLLAFVFQRMLVAALNDQHSFKLSISRWPGLPQHYFSHDGNGHDQLLRALAKGAISSPEISECIPPIYFWRWGDDDTKKFFQTLLLEAFEFAALPSNLTIEEVRNHDCIRREELLALCMNRSTRSDSEEVYLMHYFVSQCSRLSNMFKLCQLLVDFHCVVLPGRSNQGECDLIMTDVHQRLWCIIEVKHIDTESQGRTARSRRTSVSLNKQ